MNARLTRKSFTLRAFTLAELMVAILFICIALFGYVSLHLRIIHSALRLEEHEQVRVTLERNIVKMIVGCRVQAFTQQDKEVTATEGAPLQFKIKEHWTQPDPTTGFQVLSADMVWHNDFGDHGLHVESAARRFKSGW